MVYFPEELWRLIRDWMIDYSAHHRRRLAPALHAITHVPTTGIEYFRPAVTFPPPHYCTFGDDLFVLCDQQMTGHVSRFVACRYVSHEDRHPPCPYSLTEVHSMWA